jgi:predicted enzyme related to lactoylglutathione lyase
MANPVVHFEVTGREPGKLQQFYAKAFAWQIDANNRMGYGIVSGEEGGIGGGIGAADADPRVTFYVAVDDPQAYLDKMEELGGRTDAGDRDPGRGHFRSLC